MLRDCTAVLYDRLFYRWVVCFFVSLQVCRCCYSIGCSIQNVVLHNKNDIKENGTKAQTKLGDISCNTGLIIQVGRIKNKLQVIENAAAKIQEKLPNRKAHGRLASIVQNGMHLMSVTRTLDKGK